jgi:hypothetical protein
MRLHAQHVTLAIDHQSKYVLVTVEHSPNHVPSFAPYVDAVSSNNFLYKRFR